MLNTILSSFINVRKLQLTSIYSYRIPVAFTHQQQHLRIVGFTSFTLSDCFGTRSDSSMAIWRFLVASLFLSCLVEVCYGVTLSSLQKTLLVTASATPGQVLKAGEDKITVSWSFNETFSAGTGSTYKTVKLYLCYAPVSQVDRAWRKTVDNLKKDKTCQFKIVAKPYSPSNNSFTWTVKKEIPTATYFVRAYTFNSDDVQAAFGQTTDANKENNLFKVQGITGRHASLDIASACFSAFSILALMGFFYIDKRNAKMK